MDEIAQILTFANQIHANTIANRFTTITIVPASMDTLCLIQLTAWTSTNAKLEIRARNSDTLFASMRLGITGDIFVWLT